MSEESGKNYFMKQIKVLSKTNRYFCTFNLNKLLSVDFEEEIIRIFLPKNTGTDNWNRTALQMCFLMTIG